MESLGQLTGGIAHDFNNMLNVVIGNLDTAVATSRARRRERSALRLHSRSMAPRAQLNFTERLLAFARQQPLRPEPINANKLVAGMSDLLHRTLAKPSVPRPCSPAVCGGFVLDANQLESAVLNLAVNARDAMPEGGKLTVETANAASG